MFWIIMIFVLIGAIALGVVIEKRHRWDDYGMFATFLCILSSFALFILLIAVPTEYMATREKVNNFKTQKEYLEQRVSINQLEDTTLTLKKVELNEWLAKAQFYKEKYGFFTFYPDEVLDLELIK